MNDLGHHVGAFNALQGWRGAVPDGSVANFLGVITDSTFLELYSPSNSTMTVGDDHVAEVPGVSDGELFFEFAAIYEAVRAAEGQFTMVELGGGYASRCVDANAALKRYNPLPARFVVVEAEPTHFLWAREHMRVNGIDPDEHWMINAAVSDSCQPVLFLVGEGVYYNSIIDEQESLSYCDKIVETGMEKEAMRNLICTGQLGAKIPYKSLAGEHIHDVKFVSARPLSDILQPLGTVDLLDVDIQGSEVTVLPAAIKSINRKVKRLHLGTHGAAIHTFMWEMFFENEWICEYDYPPNAVVETEWGDFRTSDGILTFVNSRF